MQKMGIDVAIKFLEIVCGKEAKNKKTIAGERSARKEPIRIELTDACSCFKSKTVTPSNQPSSKLKFTRSIYQERKCYLFCENTEMWHKTDRKDNNAGIFYLINRLS